MSFNIRTSAMDHQDGDNCWDNRKETVGNIILNQRPAVAGLQVRVCECLMLQSPCVLACLRPSAAADFNTGQGVRLCSCS